MKFNALIGDAKGVDIVCKIIAIVSRICRKKCVVRLTSNDMSFLNSYNIREGVAMDFRILREDVFATYIMEGVTPEHNSIYFELSTDDLVHSMSSRESQVKFKLIKKDNLPHLKIDLITNCITNEIPINFILVRNWADYNPPNIGIPSVAVCLPSPKILAKILSSVKNMGAKNIVFKSNNNGEFCINTSNDVAKMDVYMRDLANLSIVAGHSSQEMHKDNEFFSVLLDIKVLCSFVCGLQNIAGRLSMKVVHGRGAIFSVKEPECLLTLYASGLNQDQE